MRGKARRTESREDRLRALADDKLKERIHRLEELLKSARRLQTDAHDYEIETEVAAALVDQLKRELDLANAVEIERIEVERGRAGERTKLRYEASARLVHVVKERHGLSNEQIAQECGVSPYTVRRWVRGELGMKGSARRCLLRLLEEGKGE